MQRLHRFVLVLAALSVAPPAAAQTRGTVGAGVAVSAVYPRAPELTTVPRLRPTIRRMPTSGWGLAAALNWFDAEVDASVLGGAGPLGRLSIRPLMVGLGYTAVHARLAVSPSIVGGPALATLSIDERMRDRVAVAGSAFERRLGSVSLAVRPGLSVSYALAPRLALTGFGGYLFNRPALTVRDGGRDTRVRLNADGLLLSAGILVTF